MSGDVQPRKRKDKKRRKDESAEQAPLPPQLPPQINLQNDDVNIHVHKDGGTGGNICSKIIFVLLSSALIVLIGLIITEYRGLTDLDTVDTDSRFSQIFEGWVDSAVDDHDDHDEIENAIQSHEEEDEHDQEDDNLSEEENDDDEHEEDEEDEVEATQEDDDDDEETQEDDEETHEDDEETQEDVDDDDQDNEDETVEDNEVSEEKQDEEDEDENASRNSQEDEEDEADDNEDNEVDLQEESEEQANSEEQEENDDEKEASKEKDDDDKEDSLEKEENEEDNDDDDNVVNEKVTKTEAVLEEKTDKQEEETNEKSWSNMLVKLGVGLALLVVAHVVLIKKWKSAPTDTPRNEDGFKESTPDLSRRNTIVPPPSLQEIEQDIENDEEEYSDEEGEYSEEEVHVEHKSAKAKYQELRETYSRSLTPESDPEYTNKSEQYEDEYEEDGSAEEDEVEEESEVEDFNDEADEELLKRLEAKYGKINRKKQIQDDEEQLSSWERVNPNDGDGSDTASDDEDYENRHITNEDDWQIKDKIDEAHRSLDDNAAYAIKLFDAILENFPQSPRSLYGKALALDKLADLKKSNEILQKALSTYLELLNAPKIPDALFQISAEGCINRLRFIGQYRKAISVHNALIERFPNNSHHANQLAVTYLTINSIPEARAILKKILLKWPNNGFALVHYGFILKVNDNNLEEGVKYMQKGIDTNDEGVIDGRFFFHLGDALTRLGRNDEAIKLYENGVKHEVFFSKYQRSLYNVKRLTGRPWWNKEQTNYEKLYKDLEENWMEIRKEGLAVLNQKGYFQDEAENLRDKGDWKQFELFSRGQKNLVNCKTCPVTCQIIENNSEARTCKRGQTKFSIMHPGTHVWPHCGPTNCRLRIHLGLKVPPKTYIRVAKEIRSWEEGKVFIFDDSFEHEVWHNGTEYRLVLIVDVWHPELTPSERRSLSPI